MRQPSNNKPRRRRVDNIQKFTVKADAPLLEAVAAVLKDHKPTKLKSMLRHHQFAVNGTPSSQFDRPVNAGDELWVNFDGSFHVFTHPKLKLVYEDEDIMVVDKAYGMLSTAAGNNIKDETVYNVLRKYVKLRSEHARVQEYFANEQFDKALNGDGATYTGFAKIADEYSGTDAANLANLYAGLCYANLGKWQEAQKYLEEYSSASDMMVSPAAQAALGNAYAQNGNIDKAVSCLKKAADMADSKAEDDTNNSIAPTFLLQAGELLESQNNKAEALKIYQDIKKKYVNSQLVQSYEIDKYIERVSE